MVEATVFEPSSVRKRSCGGRAEVVILDREVMEVGDDTPLRADVVERAGTDDGEGGPVLVEALQPAVPEAPPVLEEALRAAVSEATQAARTVVAQHTVPVSGPEAATQGVPASGSEMAMRGVPEEVLAASRAASGEHALVPRQGGRRAAVPQPARSGGRHCLRPSVLENVAEIQNFPPCHQDLSMEKPATRGRRVHLHTLVDL